MKEKNKTKRFRTPTVIQMEAVECGAAALGIILGYHGRNVTLEQLRVDCGVSRDGSKASRVISASEKYHLEGDGFLVQDYKDLTSYYDSLPFIIFWKNNHFLVLEGVKKGKYYLNDPAYGPRTVTEEEFKNSFSKVILTFAKKEGFESSKKEGSFLWSLLPMLTGSKSIIALVFFITLTTIIPGIILPGITSIFIDDYLLKGNKDWLNPILIAFVSMSLFAALLTWMQKTIFIRLETSFLLKSSYKFMWHILKLPVVFFSQRSAGDVISRLGSNTSIAALLSQGLASVAFNLIKTVIFAIFLFMYSWELTLVIILFSFVNILVYKITKRMKKDVSYRTQEAGAKLQGTLMLGNRNIESLKASGQEREFFSRWAGFQAKYLNASQKQTWLGMVTSIFPTICSQLSSAIVLCLGAYLIIRGEFTIGGLIAFQMIAQHYIQPINSLVNFSSGLQSLDVEVKRLNDVHNYPIDEKHNKSTEIPKKLKSTKLTGYIELKNVTFGYSRLEPPLIKNFNLKLKPGDRIALVGGSGSGKSTIAKLITGLFQPWAGEIFFDGIPISEIPSKIIANSISMVNQELFFFKDTIKENLAFWDDSVSSETLMKVTKMAEIFDEIAVRPGAFDAEMYEGGSNFSGGQLQRMEIARALINNPTILILDEASSALDPVVETKIDNNLRELGTTNIIIAHRVSTIRDSDEIIVLDKGNVIERGPHDELVKNKNLYYELIKAE